MIHIPIAICPVRPGQRWWYRLDTTFWIRITRVERVDGDWRIFFTTPSTPLLAGSYTVILRAYILEAT